MDRACYIRYWNDDTVNVFRVYLKPGAVAAGRARSGFSSAFAGHRQLFVLRTAEVRAYICRSDRPVVRPDVRADRGRRARRDPRHREHADGVDHRSAARARRAAGGGRAAQPDPPHDLDGGAQRSASSGWCSASPLGAVNLLLRPARSSQRDISGHARCRTRFPWRSRLLLVPTDSRRPRSSPRSGRRSRRCAARWWRRWNMNRNGGRDSGRHGGRVGPSRWSASARV